VALPPVLEITYPDVEAFRRDYEADLSNGGAFVPTADAFELRSRVVVRLDLRWCGQMVEMPGEVVHIVPPEMAGVGGKPGVAVQFVKKAFEVREELGPLIDAPATAFSAEATEPEMQTGDERRAVRKTARVAARIEWSGGEVVGFSRNLSRTGVLVGTHEGSVPIGEAVTVILRHPGSGEELAVRGRVARQVSQEGRGTAMGVHFEPDADNRAKVERFVGEVMSAEHTRRLGAISGPIAELGPHSTVQMLATSAPRGTILLRRGEEEGALCFDRGLLKSARLGSLRGMEALVQMLEWREGTFEFTARIEEQAGEAPMPFDAAILEAVRQIDESARVDAAQSFPLQARLVPVDTDGELEPSFSTVEAALLDLANAGFTVSRALEVIPEPDQEIFRALQHLIDSKVLELR